MAKIHFIFTAFYCLLNVAFHVVRVKEKSGRLYHNFIKQFHKTQVMNF